MIPVFEPVILGDDIKAVEAVMRSGYINEYNLTREFEKRFAEKFGWKYAVAVCNGTMALFCALRANGIRYGDRVAIPAFTFMGTATAVELAGAKPIFVDVKLEDGTIDWEMLSFKGIDAIIPVHINGAICDMKMLLRLAKHNDVKVIEDASQAHGNATMEPRSDIRCYSLATTKLITAGQCGMIVTDDEELYWKLRALKDQGRTDKSDWFPNEGYNFKITEIQAALGLSQLNKLDGRRKHMMWMMAEYAKLVDGCNVTKHVPWRIELLTEEPETLIKNLRNKGVGCEGLPLPLNLQPTFKPPVNMPNATLFRSSRIYLPSSSNLGRPTIHRITDMINEAL